MLFKVLVLDALLAVFDEVLGGGVCFGNPIGAGSLSGCAVFLFLLFQLERTADKIFTKTKMPISETTIMEEMKGMLTPARTDMGIVSMVIK